MNFKPLTLAGAFLIELVPISDERGYFARSWCQAEFEQHGLNPRLVQCNISFNTKRGTLRGLHYQAAPHAEAKLVRCTRGAIWDVIVDLRPESATFKKWEAFELTPDNQRMLYIPEGFAHGFQTLEDHSEVHYQMSEFFDSKCSAGLRWNDPQLNIAWPETISIISARDQQLPLL